MRIVCISASFIPSSTANSIQVLKAAHALAELGHDITLFTPGKAPASWDDLKSQYGLRKPFDIRWIPENLTFRRYDFTYRAIKAAQRLSPDLVYTWVLQAGLLALWHHLPVILELHDRVTGWMGPWLFRRFSAAQTPHRILTNTRALRDILRQDFNLDETQVDIVIAPNGVELERYQALPEPAQARETLGLPKGFTAGYTGHFYSGRGMALMFEMATACPDVNFLWVGGQPGDVALWQERIQTERIHNITLTGFVDNALLPTYQAAADVLLMPYGTAIAGSGGGNSAEIASPMKMFEYMAAGRAIISSDLPVIHEILDESMAVFCPPEDCQAWIKTLLALKSDPDWCSLLGKTAHDAVGKYTWRARAERSLMSFNC